MIVNLDGPITLGPFNLNFATARLSREGAKVELRPQAFRALRVLIQNPGRLVDYEQMIREAWDGVQVSKHTVAVTIGEIKTALEEYGFWISCRPKFGYCLEIPESEDLIVQGRHFRNQFTRKGFEKALHCFEQAARKDSADFRPQEAISGVRLLLAAFLLGDPRELHRGFLEAHQRAARLHGSSPEMLLDRAFGLFIFEGNLLSSEAELSEIVRQKPGWADVYGRLAMVYLALGRTDQALVLMQRSRSIDSLLPPLVFVETIVRLFQRRYDLAVQNGSEALDLHPSSQFGRVHYAEALEHSGQHEEAMTQYRLAATLAPDAPWIRATWGRFLAKVGCDDDAWTILTGLRQARATEYVDAYHLAMLLEALGERDLAFQELERAFEERAYMLLLIDGDPKADSLRGDPRFISLRDRVFRRAYPAQALERATN